MSGYSDWLLDQAAFLFRRGAFQEAADLLEASDSSPSAEAKLEHRRVEGWVRLACGDTERAYNLFWSCAHSEGARAGILLLTVLAGQVSTAVEHWQRHLKAKGEPVVALPDSDWHAPLVVKAAVQLLQQYPFKPRSAALGAATLYQALLQRALGEPPEAFFSLSKVVDFYPAARLLRDQWLDETVCLPAPREANSQPATPQTNLTTPAADASPRTAKQVLDRAARLLLYPDQPTLERQCRQALDANKWLDALEILRRLLFLDPEHTSSLERRWRVHLRLEAHSEAKADLFALVEIYEKRSDVAACQRAAEKVLELFPDDERALLRMCFLQARLDSPLSLAQYGRRLLELCARLGLVDRKESYRNWLLRQNLSLDDQMEIRSM